MSQRMKVAVPLATAAVLTAVFVLLLFQQASRNAPPAVEETAPAAEPLVSPIAPGVAIPYGTPTDPEPFRAPEPKRYEGDLHRWNLSSVELPEGWDPEVARHLHDLFGELGFDAFGTDRREAALRAKSAYDELEEYLERLGPEALPTLDTILDVEPDFVARRLVFQAVGRMGPQTEEATWVLRDYYLARSEDPSNRSEAGRVIEAMGFLKNETSYELLTELATSREHHPYRDKLIMALGEHPRREDAVDVFTRGMHDRDFQTRNKSAQALGKVQSPETLHELYDAYEGERVWYGRQTILGSIGKIGDPQALPFLEEQARSARESGVRLSAANAIRRIVEQTGHRRGRRILDELARTEPDEKVREHIARWTSRL